jgi:hypothetical protein
MTQDQGDSTDVDRAQLIAMVEALDEQNERLRLKVLDVLRFAEEAVTAQVAAERTNAELSEQLIRLEAELAAIHGTKLMRFAAPFRRVYARVRPTSEGS